MDKQWIVVRGLVVQGYQVASRPSRDYPYSSLERQKPLFKERGLDLDAFFNGTLNVSIHPYSYRLIHPEFTFRKVEWTDLHPPEDFSFSRCAVRFKRRAYAGWVYYPHPETKRRNFQDPTLIEIIAMPIALLTYGSQVELGLNPQEIELVGPRP
jgi:hypothetical protein